MLKPTHHQWFAHEPPRGALIRLEYAVTGEVRTCMAEDVPQEWDRRLVLWRETGIARMEECR